MEITDSVESILAQKSSSEIFHVAPDSTVFDAIKVMAEKNIGAILVMEEGQMVGILSERDYTRKVILEGRSSRDTLVKEIMTSPVVGVPPSTKVCACLQLMTEIHIRHLPVVEGKSGGNVVGVVSIGDLVKRTISAQEAMIGQLESYITGGYPG